MHDMYLMCERSHSYLSNVDILVLKKEFLVLNLITKSHTFSTFKSRRVKVGQSWLGCQGDTQDVYRPYIHLTHVK